MIRRERLLQLFNNDEELVDRFIFKAKEELPRELDALGASIKSGEYSNAAIIAHGLKSQTAYLGLDSLTKMAFELEQLCDNSGSPDIMNKSLSRLRNSLLLALES